MSTTATTTQDPPAQVSAVQQLLNAQKAKADALAAAKAKADAGITNPYEDQDWYLKAKVAQLKGEISLYSTLPDLDPSGSVIDSLTKEVNKLVTRQQAKLKASQDAAAAKQKELADAQEKQRLQDAIPSSDLLLKRAQDRVNGVAVGVYVSPEDQKTGTGAASGNVKSSDDMLKRVRGENVNKTA